MADVAEDHQADGHFLMSFLMLGLNGLALSCFATISNL